MIDYKSSLCLFHDKSRPTTTVLEKASESVLCYMSSIKYTHILYECTFLDSSAQKAGLLCEVDEHGSSNNEEVSDICVCDVHVCVYGACVRLYCS